MSKGYVYLWIFIGGAVGSYVPVLFHQGLMSMASILGSLVGGLLGIWVAVKSKNYL